MRITWIVRSFLDYRVPVFDNLNKLVGAKTYVLSLVIKNVLNSKKDICVDPVFICS